MYISPCDRTLVHMEIMGIILMLFHPFSVLSAISVSGFWKVTRSCSDNLGVIVTPEMTSAYC